MTILPFGNRLLVKRKIIGEKAGSIILPQQVQERFTDIAVVKYIPDLTFGDKYILDNSEKIINNLTIKAVEGDAEALEALLQINNFIKIKSIKIGDEVMISKYVGIDFHETGNNENLTIVNCDDVIAVIMKENKNGR